MKTIEKVEIITRSGVLADIRNVNSVSVPTSSGVIQILPEHSPIMTVLEIGAMKVSTNSGEETYLISGGVLKVTNNTISVLVHDADAPHNIVEEQINESIKAAEHLKRRDDLPPSELIQLEKRLLYERFKLGYLNRD